MLLIWEVGELRGGENELTFQHARPSTEELPRRGVFRKCGRKGIKGPNNERNFVPEAFSVLSIGEVEAKKASWSMDDKLRVHI